MRVVFMGSPEFAVPALEAVAKHHDVVLVVSQPDKPAGRGRKLVPPMVVSVARGLGLPVSQPRSARTPEFLEELRNAKADVGVVVAYGKILPAAVLAVFPHGCVNIHGSLLPAYRGAAPIQRAVMDGLVETGVSLMRLDEGMDTGPVYLERRVAIADDDTAGTMASKLAPVGADALIEVLSDIETGRATLTAQDDSLATHAAMLTKNDGNIDWTASARAVSAHVRGVDPWPGGFSYLGGERIRMFSPVVVAGEGVPGKVVEVDRQSLVIACGVGAVRIAEVQAPGKRRMSAGDFARGRSLKAGAEFKPEPAE